VIACGGTGGHLFPGIAVAEELRTRGHQAILLISEKQVDREGAKKYRGLHFATVPAVAKPATLSPKMLPFLWRLWRTAAHCTKLLQTERADTVLGMGGFTSLPPVFAGHRLGLPTFVHDSNALPGRANRLTARFCTKVLLGMAAAVPHFGGRPTVVTGTPVRLELRELPPREVAAAGFGLDPTRPVVLVTGGSQGARRLNELVPAAAASLPAEWQVLHIAGGQGEQPARTAAAGRAGYQVVGFCDQMGAAYAAADLVVGRAGASSLTELAHAGLPAILIPYPYAADDHQTRNAEIFAAAGAAELVPERELDADRLAARIRAIIGDSHRRATMAQAARRLDTPDAAARVAAELESACSVR
jgi:UDP-N-acetylglucosamine--N-acetylmuramyl-(pentapeptide) pyrophosphoryl-undecaprenol N-acetylglucosamine transferase